MEPKIDALKDRAPKRGLSPEDHGLLNNSMLPKEERRKIFAAKREEYAHDKVALQQIDVYDGESPYHPKFREYRDALRSGNQSKITELEAWLKANYPDV